MYTQNQTRQYFVVNSANQIAVSKNDENEISIGYSISGKKPTINLVKGGMNDIVEAHITYAADMKYTSKATVVTLDSNYTTEGSPINGQDYLVNINIPQYYVKTDLVDTWKHGCVHAAGNMTASDFYAKMALSLFANFSREPWPILKFGLTTSDVAGQNYSVANDSNITWIGNTDKFEDHEGQSYTALIIDECEQDWHLGKMDQEPVIYSVHCDTIVYAGDTVTWGKTKKFAGTLEITNGKKIASQEWFYHGERGDIYREMAWPNNFDNIGVADPAAEYDVIDIHYYWQGANHAIQKSEKWITVAVLKSQTSTVLGKFNTASITVDGAN